MYRVVFIVFLALIVLFGVPNVKSKTDPKLKYFTMETEHFYIHYPAGMEELALRTGKLAETMRSEVGAKLGWSPNGMTHIVISDASDLANGFTTVFPYRHIQLFAASPIADESLSYYDDWLRTLVAHEYAHVAHLDQTGGVPAVMRYFMGTLISMNSLEPAWMVEGMGTYFETILTSMGRGRSTYKDMILRMAALEGRLDNIDRAGGGLIKWPAGDAAYIFGVSFLQYLADNYGEERIMEFSKLYSSRMIPFRMNAAAKKVFGKNFIKLWDEWRTSIEAKYSVQAEMIRKRSLTESKALTDMGFMHQSPEFTPDGKSIIFYHRNPDGPTWIKRFDVSTGHIEELFKAEPFGNITISPDGKSIALAKFSTGDSERPEKYYGYFDIYVYSMDGKDVERKTKSARALDPCISSDGTVYFAQRTETGSMKIAWVYDGQLLPNEQEPKEVSLGLEDDGPQISGLSCSNTGSIAFSAWTLGGNRDIFVVDLNTSEVKRLTYDKAMDTYPSFSADGKMLVFSSDRDGVSNIYSYDLDADELRRVTNVLGGAFQPSLSPDNENLTFLSYSSKGYDVVLTEFVEGVSIERTIADEDFDRSLLEEAANDDKDAKDDFRQRRPSPIWFSEPKKYSPWSSLLPPRYLLPIISSDGVEWSLGAMTGSMDALGKHFYNLSAYYGTKSEFVSAGAIYGLDTFESTILLNAFIYSVPYGKNAIIELKDLDGDGVLTSSDDNYFEERLVLEAGLSYTFTPLSTNLTVMGFFHYEEHDNITSIPRFAWEEVTPFRGKLVGPRLAMLLSSMSRYAYSISAENGGSLYTEVEFFDESFGADLSQQVLTADLRLFISIPYFPPHHVLALRAGGGYTWGDNIYPGHFRVGGSLGTSIISGADEKYFILRGFPTSQFVGESALVFNSEYRFPISYPERGWGLKPVFLRALHGALFADIGNAFVRDNMITMTFAGTQITDLSGNPLLTELSLDEEFKIGVGAELRADVLLGWNALIGGPLTFRLGFADDVQGEDGIGPLVYMDLGTTF